MPIRLTTVPAQLATELVEISSGLSQNTTELGRSIRDLDGVASELVQLTTVPVQIASGLGRPTRGPAQNTPELSQNTTELAQNTSELDQNTCELAQNTSDLAASRTSGYASSGITVLGGMERFFMRHQGPCGSIAHRLRLGLGEMRVSPARPVDEHQTFVGQAGVSVRLVAGLKPIAAGT